MQGKSTAKQVHAALQLKFQEDHLRAGKELPAKNLLEYVAYQTAQSAAHKAGLTEKGERTDRDPQVWMPGACRQAVGDRALRAACACTPLTHTNIAPLTRRQARWRTR
jgi:hypothetical protein